MKRRISALVFCLTLATPSFPQGSGWGNLDQVFAQTFPGQIEASFWLPNNADPSAATEALAVAYLWIVGSAGSTSISTAHFARSGPGLTLQARVTGLFGQSPRDAVFLPDRIEVTTTMLGPGEPRCCPTLPVRWSIDRRTMVATRLN